MPKWMPGTPGWRSPSWVNTDVLWGSTKRR